MSGGPAVDFAKAPNGVDELFHRINRAIPSDQKILALLPDMLARDAIKLLGDKYFSQAPVVIGSKVLGVFSFRSFARKTAEYSLEDLAKHKHSPGDLTVEECMEKANYADLTDDLNRHFDNLERDNSVFVGTPNSMLAILTPMDVLRYFYRVASPFVALSEIELSLRTIIRSAATEPEIGAITEFVLKRQFGQNAEIPKSLEEMSFDNYRLIVASGDTWPRFQNAFGGSRERVSGKLKDTGELRNILFHFKRPISEDEIQKIGQVRDWLLNRVEQVNHRSEGQENE